MVFVTLGNQNFPFPRLLQAVDELTKKGIINQNVIVQSGYTKYDSELLYCQSFFSKDVFNEHIKSADFVISHAGTGSIISCLKHHKKVIVAPRLKEFNEHIDNHQLEILDIFSKKNLIIELNKKLSNFEDILLNIDSIRLNKFESNTTNFNQQLTSIITQIIANE